MDELRAYGLSLIQQHKREFVEAITRQVEQSLPAIASVDRQARIGSVMSLINALEGVLSGRRDAGHVLELVKQITALRRMAGVGLRSMVAATHCYLPVARRVLVARADDPLHGLRAYEALESDLLRLVIDATLCMLPEEENVDDEEEDTVTDPVRKRFTLAPFTEY